ncbi:MAG: phosphotransferase, partial [Caulobacteraceae bacterium]
MEPKADPHLQIAADVARIEFGESPRQIARMAVGLANEVYAVSLESGDVIVRLNRDSDLMRGAEEHIRLFASLDIPAPRVLAADYSKSRLPLAYQVQTRLAGEDIGQVIQTLADSQLRAIARDIAVVVRRLESLPTNGRFGWVGGGKEASYATWLDLLEGMRRQIAERTAKTKVVGPRYLAAVSRLLDLYGPAFEKVASTFYY